MVAISKQQNVADLPLFDGQDSKLLTVIESVPSGIIITDARGKIVLCNTETEKMFGYGDGELIGQEIECLVPRRARDRHPELRDGFAAKPSKRQMGAGRDLTGVKKDGSEIPVEIGLNHINTADGIFVLASIVNITERKAVEEKLHTAYLQVQQKNEEMEQFVYTVSHDLKAPLVTSTSFMSFLKEDIAAGKYNEVGDSLERLDKAHKRMQELISDLLQLSRAGRMELELSSIPLREIMNIIIEEYSDKIEQKKIDVRIPEDLPVITGDRKRVHQIFENLINNAIKYSSDVPSPQIQVLWRDEPAEFQIGIKDNGPGIEPKYHQKIFGLFQRLDTDKEGTGVGLTIVSRVIKLHGGRVWVVSDRNLGAEIWVSFPKVAIEK